MAYTQTLTVNASGVFALFEQAISHNLKWPKIRLQTPSGQSVVLARAGVNSKYTGQIMVTDGGPFGANTYFGRVDSQGVFHVNGQANHAVSALLVRLGRNPAEVAREYGKLTGNCCFCGLKLTDARSTSMGYGPICADHFGLPWGENSPRTESVQTAMHADLAHALDALDVLAVSGQSEHIRFVARECADALRKA